MADDQKEHERVMFSLRSLVFLAVVGVIAIVVIRYLQPVVSYYAVQSQNNKTVIVPIDPLKNPINSRQALLKWVTTAVTSAFTYDANNYQTWLPKVAGRYFTPASGRVFLTAMLTSGQIQQVLAKQLIVSSVVSNSPVILQAGYVTGAYSWRIQMPIIVSYQSASEVFQERQYVNLLVQRVSTNENPYGIAIQEFTTERQ